MKEVTILILNWNGKHWLEKFLPSVIQNLGDEAHLLVIDNGSTDESVSFLKQSFSEIELVILDKNYGFTGGNNRGLSYVKTPFVLLLNSDVEVGPDWLNPLLNTIKSDSSVAAVQPKVRSYHQKTHFEYAGAAGGFLDKFYYPFCRGRIFDTLEEDKGQYDQPIPIAWATGACCLIRMDVIKQIGLFDEDFFAHMEEIDFCWRAQNHGYKILVEPRSVVYHVGGGTLPQSSPFKTYLNVRNSLSMIYKNLPSRRIFLAILTRLILDGVWGASLLLKGQGKAVLAIIRGHFHFYGQLGTLSQKRKQIKHDIPHHGFYPKSIVWQYFARGKKNFDTLIQEKKTS